MAQMTRLDKLRSKVRALYGAENPNREDWADWLAEHHVFVVADCAATFAKRFGVDPELASAAGMLHDNADAVMSRFNPMHEEITRGTARRLLSETGFSEAEIAIIVDDAMKFHACHGNERPATPAGKITATADAYVHLTSDFYEHAFDAKVKQYTIGEIKRWVLPKLDRDLNSKIAFDEVREEARPAYEKWKAFFEGVS
jgi:HD superfamily phosphodiesterase